MGVTANTLGSKCEETQNKVVRESKRCKRNKSNYCQEVGNGNQCHRPVTSTTGLAENRLSFLLWSSLMMSCVS